MTPTLNILSNTENFVAEGLQNINSTYTFWKSNWTLLRPSCAVVFKRWVATNFGSSKILCLKFKKIKTIQNCNKYTYIKEKHITYCTMYNVKFKNVKNKINFKQNTICGLHCAESN